MSNGDNKKFCNKCHRNGVKSVVYVGTASRTLMAINSYYDEDGNYQHNDPNKTTIQYTCSNGHNWSETE